MPSVEAFLSPAACMEGNLDSTLDISLVRLASDFSSSHPRLLKFSGKWSRMLIPISCIHVLIAFLHAYLDKKSAAFMVIR